MLDLGIAAIVAARMGSSRLPGKMMLDIAGKPMLWHVLDRVRQAKLVTEVVLATSTDPRNQSLVELAENMSIRTYSGSENDVLGRYVEACAENTNTVVRITGDCPCIDPAVIDSALAFFFAGDYDVVTNRSSYPDGLDVEVLRVSVLRWMNQCVKNPKHREHVTSFLYSGEVIELSIGRMLHDYDISLLKLSVDTQEDLDRVRGVYEKLGSTFCLEDILALEEIGGF